MDIGLTTLSENDIAGHIGTMQAMLERASIVVTEDRSRSATELAGTRRRFVSTISTAPQRQARDIRFLHRLQAIHPDDTLLTPEEHALAYKLRRGMAVGHAVADVFARQTELEKLQQQNRAGALSGEAAQRFHNLQNTAAFVAAFTAARFLLDALPANGESQSDQPPRNIICRPCRPAPAGLTRSAHSKRCISASMPMISPLMASKPVPQRPPNR